MAKAPDEMSEGEIALLDAARTLFDIVLAARLTTHATADKMLGLHQQRWTKEGKLKAAGMIGMLRALSTSPDARKHQETALKLRMARPKGSG